MSNTLLRAARYTDLSAIHHLAKQRGIGMTSLPNDLNLLEQRLEWSIESFNKTINTPEHEYYLFVLEDRASQHIIGTSAIDSFSGAHTPFYSYRISKHTQVCDFLNTRNDFQLLTLVNDNQGRSELCTLFLDPMHRRKNNGLLLSRARFLFMANFPERVTPLVIAEMRGFCDESGLSPFWSAIGQHFFHMPFAEADRLTLATNRQFIADLMPKTPIYVNLLPPDAQMVIGKTHPWTEGALSMLLREGFEYSNYIDIFDGGPLIHAPIDRIHTIKTSQILIISHIENNVLGQSGLVSNISLNFRATTSPILVNANEPSCTISKETAELLQVNCGDVIRFTA